MWRNWQTHKTKDLMKAISCRFKSCHPHQQKESSTNSTAFFLPFRIAERLEPAVQPPGRRAPPFWRLLPPFPPLNGGIYLLSAPQKEGSANSTAFFCRFPLCRMALLYCLTALLSLAWNLSRKRESLPVIRTKQNVCPKL